MLSVTVILLIFKLSNPKRTYMAWVPLSESYYLSLKSTGEIVSLELACITSVSLSYTSSEPFHTNTTGRGSSKFTSNFYRPDVRAKGRSLSWALKSRCFYFSSVGGQGLFFLRGYQLRAVEVCGPVFSFTQVPRERVDDAAVEDSYGHPGQGFSKWVTWDQF